MKTLGWLLVSIALAAAAISAQSGKLPPGASYGADPSYKVPRTADGHPDLQGVWSNNHVTPVARPTQWKDKEVITDAELHELQSIVARNEDQAKMSVVDWRGEATASPVPESPKEPRTAAVVVPEPPADGVLRLWSIRPTPLPIRLPSRHPAA